MDKHPEEGFNFNGGFDFSYPKKLFLTLAMSGLGTLLDVAICHDCEECPIFGEGLNDIVISIRVLSC